MSERKLGQVWHRVARYTNVQGMGIAIVASITEGVDWAAYIGWSAGSETESYEQAFDYGNKLSEEDARYYFPDMKELRYRP